MRGTGIRDGRGYGPYGTGYTVVGARALPLGPRGEVLGADYDFRPGPNGRFWPVRRRPLRELPVPIGGLSGFDQVGDTELPAEVSDQEWRRRMLEAQTSTRDWQRRWVLMDERQRWLQIGATLAIPLAAAVWRWILKSKAPTL